uniref:Uncharacterized protein n=1 Tax=Anabas testudineus TaxID=64144 RepID=A0A3Q1IR20_ANATE
VIRWDTYLPAFLTNPTSASTAWQMSQQKQSGCQLLFMALMTRPMMNSNTVILTTLVTARSKQHLEVIEVKNHSKDSKYKSDRQINR